MTASDFSSLSGQNGVVAFAEPIALWFGFGLVGSCESVTDSLISRVSYLVAGV